MEQNKKIEKEDQSAFSIKKQIIYIVVFVALIALTFYAIVSQNENLTLEGFLDYTFSLKIGWLIAAVMCVFMFILLEGLSIRYIAAKLGYKRGYYQSLLGSRYLFLSNYTISFRWTTCFSFLYGKGQNSNVSYHHYIDT